MATRLEIIDETLVIMGWPKQDFHPGKSIDVGGYTDYLLKSDAFPLLVVEAKRVGQTFTLPESVNKREYTAKYLSNSFGHDLREAMQALLTDQHPDSSSRGVFLMNKFEFQWMQACLQICIDSYKFRAYIDHPDKLF